MRKYRSNVSIRLNLKESEGVPGKYTICYNSYERYGSGELHTKSFSAKDDLDAILKIKKHEVDPIHGLAILIDDNTIYDEFYGEPQSLEDAADVSGFESVEDYKDEIDIVSSIEEILESIEDKNGDGGDYIFYIKRPDGTYLFKADGVDVDSDWDDDVLEEETIGRGKYGIEVKDPRGIWVPASENYPKNGRPVEFKKEDEAKNSDLYKRLVDRYGKDRVRTYKQSRPEN